MEAYIVVRANKTRDVLGRINVDTNLVGTILGLSTLLNHLFPDDRAVMLYLGDTKDTRQVVYAKDYKPLA